MKQMNVIQALREALSEEMTRDEKVFILGEDVGFYGGAFGVTNGLMDRFGEHRVRDTPISESAIVGAGIGAALTGMRPVAEIMFMDFLTVAMDQIVNQAAKIRYMFGGNIAVPLVIRTPGGAGGGAAAQHSQSFESWFMNVPGLKIVLPATPADAKGLLKSAIRDDNPVLFVEHKLLYRQKGDVPEDEYLTPIGEAACVRRGQDFTLVSASMGVHKCVAAAGILSEQHGIECDVIDLRSLAPLDFESVRGSVTKTGGIAVVHEACTTMGWGAEIAARIAGDDTVRSLRVPVLRIGAMDVPVPYSPELEHAVVPQVETIVSQVTAALRAAKGAV